MMLLQRRREVALAEARVARERERWREDSASIKKNFAAHRVAWILGGGFASGAVAGLIPVRGVARAGGFFASLVSFVLRSPLGAMLIDGATRQAAASASAAPTTDVPADADAS